ncbi:MAG: hypothetical protein ACREJB_15105, partial [Planctomycetaceae bacterium]
RVLALIHGSFAGIVFSMMAALAVVTSRRWNDVNGEPPKAHGPRPVGLNKLKTLTVAATLLILLQSALGGLLRHLGTALFEHVGLAFVVLAVVIATGTVAMCSGMNWLKRSGAMLLLLVALQAALGAGAFVTKYGFPPTGYVAVQHAPLQVALRTSHTVVGMLLLAASVVCALRVFRLAAFARANPPLAAKRSNEGRAMTDRETASEALRVGNRVIGASPTAKGGAA